MIYELKKRAIWQYKRYSPQTMGQYRNNGCIKRYKYGMGVCRFIGKTPATALLWSKGIEGFYFIGNPDNHTFNAEIIEFIINHLRFRIIQSGLNHFEFSGDCIMWDSVLEKIFNFKELIKSRQCVYQLDFDKWKYHKTNGLCKDTDIRKNRFEFNTISRDT